MKRLAVLTVVGLLVLAGTAAAAGPIVPWTAKDMKTAVRGLAYPKAGAKKLACRGLGTTTQAGWFSSFRCVATYRHHRRRVFYTQGQGLGGWICAGPTLATCKVLRHGFVTSGQAANGGTAVWAQLAARGFVENRYSVASTVVTSPCRQSGTNSWTCGYGVAAGDVTVTVSLKAVTAGYVVTATATVQ